ncbi:hypothetical protein [Rhizobium sp. CCGE 510]|uniref:hypothetical protein n=1 Tax=Rhizobium sp. CCGE 510 TaxID=1132836 RepID=UPI00027B7E87|nr:hypothetical protein [Rhizobium sp. CCGE 510]EJT04967.1 hypothetical protein RCCGE510_12566 [Rhizobium sp. CCGE 510]
MRIAVLPLLTALVASVFGFAVPAQATKMNGMQFFVLNGTCDKLVVGNLDWTASCDGKLMSTSYSNRRVGFHFITKDAKGASFSGMDGANPSKDADVTNIDEVILDTVGAGKNPKPFEATGKCLYSNPYTGDPTTVSCSGKMKDGRTFSAIFTTDGSPPQ